MGVNNETSVNTCQTFSLYTKYHAMGNDENLDLLVWTIPSSVYNWNFPPERQEHIEIMFSICQSL